MNAILQRDKRTADDVAPTPHDVDAFLRYFDEKVKSVRAATASHPLLVQLVQLNRRGATVGATTVQ